MQRRASLSKLVAALAAVYVIWGSTYTAIAVAIETLPPFLMASVRWTIAGGLLYLVLRLRGAPTPRPAELRASAVSGLLFIVAPNGFLTWAEQHVPSGFAALLVASASIWTVLLSWWAGQERRPDARAIGGLLAGVLGVAVLVGPVGLGGTPAELAATLAILAGTVTWAMGVVHARRQPPTGSPWMSVAVQMLAAGAVLGVMGTVAGEPAAIDLARVSARSLAAVGYLIVAGSIVGYGAYAWILRNAPPSAASTHQFVNPLVAVLLGWALLGEPVAWRTAGAAVLIAAGVALLVTRRAPPPAPAASPAKPAIEPPAGAASSSQA